MGDEQRDSWFLKREQDISVKNTQPKYGLHVYSPLNYFSIKKRKNDIGKLRAHLSFFSPIVAIVKKASFWSQENTSSACRFMLMSVFVSHFSVRDKGN